MIGKAARHLDGLESRGHIHGGLGEAAADGESLVERAPSGALACGGGGVVEIGLVARVLSGSGALGAVGGSRRWPWKGEGKRRQEKVREGDGRITWVQRRQHARRMSSLLSQVHATIEKISRNSHAKAWEGR